MPMIDINFQKIAEQIDIGFGSFFRDGENPHSIKRFEISESYIDEYSQEMKKCLEEYINLKAEMQKKLVCNHISQ